VRVCSTLPGLLAKGRGGSKGKQKGAEGRNSSKMDKRRRKRRGREKMWSPAAYFYIFLFWNVVTSFYDLCL